MSNNSNPNRQTNTAFEIQQDGTLVIDDPSMLEVLQTAEMAMAEEEGVVVIAPIPINIGCNNC